jgi:hypothetical protein
VSARAVAGDDPPAIGLVHPCDALALQAAEGLMARRHRAAAADRRPRHDRPRGRRGRHRLRGYEIVDTRDGRPVPRVARPSWCAAGR